MPKTQTHQGQALRAKPPHGKALGDKPALQPAPVSKISPAKSPAAKALAAKSSRDKVREHRKRMRAKGLRLVQMWLPDTRTPEYREQAHRASLAIARSQTEQEEQAFIDSVSWWSSKEAEALWRSEPEGWWKEPEG
jgi:hypothetical protein